MMTYTEVSVCLLLQPLLLLLGAGTLVNSDEIPLIQWEADCDNYQVTTGKYPNVLSIHSQHSTPLATCRSRCTGRVDCGGFYWSTGNSCYLTNINDRIIEQYLSQNWYLSSSSHTWYSKSCDYNVGDSDLTCDIYIDHKYDNLYPVSKWRITYAGWIPALTVSECRRWCSLYTGCRSATYTRFHSDGSGVCYLYSTTIRDLLDSGLTGDVSQYTGTDRTITNYDRYCAGGQPYIPGQETVITTLVPTTVQTTTEPTTTSVTTQTTTTETITESCGVQDIGNIIGNGNTLTKIVGGTIAVSGSWPWQVQLKAYGQHQCGGSILSSEWILTAAKCFNLYPFTSAWSVHAGSWRERYTDSTESVHPVDSIIIHSEYSAGSADHDIALVKLSIPITFSTHRKPVCLPESDSSAHPVPPGTMCYVTGWGLTHDTGHAGYLKQTYLPVVSETACRLAHPGVITSSMVCAGYSHVNTHRPCHGDTGGPLVREASGVWYLEGVVSYMDEYCTDVNKPAVFTSTRAYTNWIHNTMGLH